MISKEEVQHIAELAKLKLTDEELQDFSKQLGRILEHFRKLEELDTRDVEPLKHVMETENILREDEPEEPVSREEALKNAPKKRDGFFEVPKAFKQSSRVKSCCLSCHELFAEEIHIL